MNKLLYLAIGIPLQNNLSKYNRHDIPAESINQNSRLLSNPYYLEGKVAFLENKHECPYQPGPEKGMWLAGVAEMREELRVLRESLSMQARDTRDGWRVPAIARHNSLQ